MPLLRTHRHRSRSPWQLANEAKEAKRAWREQFEKNEKHRLARARANRKHAEEVRQRAREAKHNQTNNRQSAGTKMQRKVDADAEKAKADLMNYKRNLRQQRYQSRFASTQEAELLQKSTFRKLYGLPDESRNSPTTSTVGS